MSICPYLEYKKRIKYISKDTSMKRPTKDLLHVKPEKAKDKPKDPHQMEIYKDSRLLSEIIESIKDGGFFYLDRNWCFIFVNRRMADYLGVRPEDLIGENFWEKFPQYVGTVHEVYGRRAMDFNEVQNYETKGVLLTDNWYNLTLYPSERGILVYWQDITERKVSEDALIESQKCLQSALTGAEAGMWIWNLKDDEWQITQQVNTLFGRPVEPLMSFEEYSSQIHIEDFDRIKKGWKDTIQCTVPYDQEFRIIWPDGSIHWLASKGGVIRLPSGVQKFVGICFDITERKRAEEDLIKAKEELEGKVLERTAQLEKTNENLLEEIEEHKDAERKLRSAQKDLRAMASEIILADERLRQHFASELHDSVIQTLGAAKLRIQLFQEYIPKKAVEKLSEVQDMLSQAIQESRQIMSELSPPVLSELGFLPAMEWLTEQFGSQNGLDVKFRVKNDSDFKTLGHELQVLLFQATRELLMNVIKHSKAKEAVVLINQKKNTIRVTVKDDGVGFHGNVSFREDKGGFGLFSIRERLRHLGGQLIIESKPGKGTRVTMVSPKSIVQ